jgi:hypothetical protein
MCDVARKWFSQGQIVEKQPAGLTWGYQSSQLHLLSEAITALRYHILDGETTDAEHAIWRYLSCNSVRDYLGIIIRRFMHLQFAKLEYHIQTQRNNKSRVRKIKAVELFYMLESFVA